MEDIFEKSKKSNNQSGMTLMEVLVSLFIIMVLTVGVYNLVLLSLNLTSENKYYVEAIEIANQKMEQIRNMAYSDVGVVSGIPSGTIPQVETINREGEFTVNTYVTFYDDPFDGQAGSTTPDTIPTDYKIASVKVSWQTKAGEKNLTVFSKIIPRTMETSEGYGLLKITVSDSSAQPVPNANVRVVNNLVSPPIDVVNITDSNGRLYLPATSSVQGYEITVTKTDEEPAIYYGQDQTYGTSTGKSPYHLTVSEGDMTEEAFTIDKLATINVKTVSASLPDNFRVNEENLYRSKSAPAFSFDSSDNMYFVWQDYTSTSSYVYMQKYDSLKTKQWASDLKISNTVYQENSGIVTTALGDSFVVWQDNSSSLKLITRAKGESRFVLNEIHNISPALAYAGGLDFYTDYKQTIFNTSKDTLAWFSLLSDFSWQDIEFSSKNVYHLALDLWQGLKIKPAKAIGSVVQTKIGNPENSANSLNTTFDSSPSSGNVIIAIAVHRNAGNTFSAPTNSAGVFTEAVYSNSAWYLDVGIWYKIAGAGEPTQVTINNNGDIDGGVLMLMEVSGLDTGDLLEAISSNDQTGSNSNTAHTGSTAVTQDTGFAVAAIGWGDNNFDTADSSDWSSVSADFWNHELWFDWSTGNNGTLAAASLNITSADSQRATLLTTGGGAEQRNSVIAVFNTINTDVISLSATGTQISSIMLASTSEYIGGAFVVRDESSSRNVEDITISESGSIDGSTGLDNIKLYYDIDNSAPYDCFSESFSGAEAQFGSTDTDGFSAANGTSTFSDIVGISTTEAMCVYVVMDIAVGVAKNESIEISVNDPELDIVLSAGTVIAGPTVSIDGTTYVYIPAETLQEHYRWRYDNGSELGASWKEAEDTVASVMQGSNVRLRFKLANIGSLNSVAAQYRIEYSEKSPSCGSLGWTALPYNNTLDWRMASSTYFSDADPTIQQLSNTELHTFTSGEMMTTGNQSSAITLSGNQATELEYSISATASVSSNAYCFRLTDNGSLLDAYSFYPEIVVVGDNNIYILNLDSNGSENWAIKRVNSDNSNAEQIKPQIAMTENYGTATTVVVWQDNRSGDYDIYAQSLDYDGNRLWNGGSDMLISASSTNEVSPQVIVDSNDNIYIVWVDESASNKHIYVNRYDIDANTLWSSPKMVLGAVFDAYQPRLSLDSSDNLYISYTESALGTMNVYLAKFNSVGQKLWESQANVENLSDDQFLPALAMSVTEAYVSWTDKRDVNYDIYAQKFDLSGNSQWASDLRINVNIGSSTQNYSSLAVDSSGDPWALWQDDRNGSNEVYASSFSDPGAVSSISNVPFVLRGTKTISETPPTYEYDRYLNTGLSSESDNALEWDTPGYYLDLVATATALTIEMLDPVQPLEIMPDETIDWYVYVK